MRFRKMYVWIAIKRRPVKLLRIYIHEHTRFD